MCRAVGVGLATIVQFDAAPTGGTIPSAVPATNISAVVTAGMRQRTMSGSFVLPMEDACAHPRRVGTKASLVALPSARPPASGHRECKEHTAHPPCSGTATSGPMLVICPSSLQDRQPPTHLGAPDTRGRDGRLTAARDETHICRSARRRTHKVPCSHAGTCTFPFVHFHRASIAWPGKSEVVRRRMRNAATCENAPPTSAEIRLANLPSW